MRHHFLKPIGDPPLEHLIIFDHFMASLHQAPAYAGAGNVAFGDGQARLGDEAKIGTELDVWCGMEPMPRKAFPSKARS